MGYQSELQQIGIDTKGQFSGTIKTICPWCSHTRRKQRDPSLSVNIDEGLYKCHNCQKKGSVMTTKTYTRPEPKQTAPNSRVVEYFENRGIHKDTVDAFGITMSAEWMPSGERVPVICFNYFDGKELINIKYKTSNKQFKMVTGAKKIPYNLNSIKESDKIIICEGEEETMCWHQEGFPYAVSCPNGASPTTNNLEWLDATYNYFEDKLIYIATDNDAPGQKLAEDLVRRFDPSNVFLIKFPDGFKDANDLLKEYDEGVLKALFEDAQPIPVKEISEASDFEELILHYQENGFPVGEKVHMRLTDEHLSWNRGDLVVLSGVPGMGKSTWADYMFVRLSVFSSWKFSIFSPENLPPMKIMRMVEQLMGKSISDLSREEVKSGIMHIRERFFFYNTEKMEDYSIDGLLSIAKTMIRRYGVDCLCLDPFNYIENNSKEDSAHEKVGELLRKLKKFAVTNNIVICLVAHPRKQDKSNGQYNVPRMYDIAQSSHFFNVPDVGIIIHRNYVDGVNDSVELYVQKMKYHFRGKLGSVEYFFDRATGRYSEDGKFERLFDHLQKQWSFDYEPESSI
jgi:twinkle protein